MNTIAIAVRYIECDCGEWEAFPADMPRHKTQTFTHIRNVDDNEAHYLCDCGRVAVSKCKSIN